MARVLAHPLRDRVLFEYRDEPASPSQVARRLGQRVNLVSYHTGVLARHGCVELVRTARRRGATEHFYRATVAQTIEDDEWMEMPAQLRRAIVLRTLDEVANEARRAGLGGGFDASHSHLSRLRLELDDEGMLAVAQTLRRAVEELERISAARRESPAPGRRLHEVAILGFDVDARR